MESIARGDVYTSQGLKNVDVGLSKVVDENKKNWHTFLQIEETKIIRSELDWYLEAAVDEEVPNFVILKWSKENLLLIMFFLHMARDISVIPVSTIASKSAFSTGGRAFDEFLVLLFRKL